MYIEIKIWLVVIRKTTIRGGCYMKEERWIEVIIDNGNDFLFIGATNLLAIMNLESHIADYPVVRDALASATLIAEQTMKYGHGLVDRITLTHAADLLDKMYALDRAYSNR